MSTVRTLALGALMLVGVAGVSAAQSTATPRRPEAGSYRRGPGGGFGRDLNLTDAQKAQIKAIRAKYQPQNQALRAQAKPYMDAAKAARQKGDTVAFRSNMEKAHQVMQNASYRTQEQAEIRAVLTPEQQAKFDAQAKARAEGGHKGWGHKGKGAKPATK
ncbi:MAG TPA: Spy/CpxP family protein refolding chaperone [Gemmatimonadaceae bacterium]|jgi:Spy/CpxP family protein refolding chaperone|nr:Spy/CpxP family protein refolding chaperone [Gemmatimonadaceae bacterium]